MIFLRKIVLLFALIWSSVCFATISETQSEINTYLSKGQYDSAEFFIRSELNQPLKFEDKIELNYQLVSVLIYSSKYKQALEVAFESIDQIKQDSEKARFYFLIGCIFYSVEDYEKTIEYFDILLTGENASLNAKALLILSDIYVTKNDMAKSITSLKRAFEIGETNSIDAKLKEQISLQYTFQIKDYEACKLICSKILEDSSNFLITQCNALSTIGDCLTQQDSLDNAISFYEKALALTIKTNDPDLIKTTSSLLIKSYEAIGNQEKANSYHKIYNDAINDSAYFSIDKYRELYALETDRSKDENQPKQTKSSNAVWYILLFLFAGIVIGLVFYFKRRKAPEDPPQKTQKKIQINSEELEKIERVINAFISDQLFLTPNITRKSFCEESGIKSERYLSEFINDRHGKSFSVFLNDLRVEYAHQRLKNDKLFRQFKTSEIAKSSGFGSKKTFERAFSTKYGKTPFDFITSLPN
ncbi:MAG: helix-turn-helix domain-containing protein [Crocinitomicaceae bacterium]